jgi:hypothetical protein
VFEGGSKSETGRDSAHSSISRNNQHERRADALRGFGNSSTRISDWMVDSDNPVTSETASRSIMIGFNTD